MSKIIFPFKKSRDSELAKEANRILSNVKDNTFYPDTSLVQELENKLTDFQGAMNNAADGSKTLIAIRKEKRSALIDVMVQLGFYVMQVSKGDRVKLLSSGFNLAKESGVAKLLATIQSLTVTNGKTGEASILVSPVKGARAFIHQYSADPPSETTAWVSETTAHRKHTFTGLKPLVTYWFRVIAIGRNGQSVTSDAISRIIL